MLFAHLLPVVPFLSGFSYPLGWCLLAIQTAILYLKTDDDRLPVYVPVYGAMVMAYLGLLGQGANADSRQLLYHAAALTFVVLTVSYGLAGPAPHGTPLGPRVRGAFFQGIVLAIALSASFVTSSVIKAYQRDIDLTFANLVGAVAPSPKVGFSTQSRLGSVKRLKLDDGKKVALRVYGATKPEYLRGCAYDAYDGTQWRVSGKSAPLASVSGGALPAELQPAGALFEVCASPGPYATLTISPETTFEGFLFAPLDTAYLGIHETSPTVDTNSNLKVFETPENLDYDTVIGSPVLRELSADALRGYTSLPSQVDPRVQDLAARLFTGCTSAQEKAAAVVRYFANHYTYQLGIEIPDNQDPVTYFLIEQPPAHCEFFATGAALLLRLGGVPCRYVTGFVASERNSFGGYWVAHNRDAHAWVEIYDDAQGAWVTVEPTVSAGVPQSDSEAQTGPIAQLREFIAYVIHRIRSAIVTGNWRQMLPIVKSLRAGLRSNSPRAVWHIRRTTGAPLADCTQESCSPGVWSGKRGIAETPQARGPFRAP